MYLGYLTTLKASKAGLARLTEEPLHSPDFRFNLIYETKSARILVPMRWADWCEVEAKRIGADQGRSAAVVKKGDTLAVYVNWVAGNPQDRYDDDEESNGAEEMRRHSAVGRLSS